MSCRTAIQALAVAAGLTLSVPAVPRIVLAQGDLDAFMQRVVTRRDENWKKLQQYILDESETVDVRGPSGARVWGEEREYTWFIKEGFFIRSPVKFNGVTISDGERREYEARYLRREQRRELRATGRLPPTADATDADSDDAPRDVSNLIQQSREPRFVSSAYFLRFRFDEGKYALAGREQLDGRDVLKIEYYPANLFRPGRGPGRLGNNPVDTETRRLLNKVAIVTLWIDPESSQILKYTFDNIDLDFLPAQWLVRVDDVHATMTMAQPFPEVWLPQGIDMNVALALAIGEFKVRYQLNYHNYRQAEATSTLVPAER